MELKQLKRKIIEVKQSIGSYYIASINAKELLEISYIDRVRLEKEGKNQVASYLGIQRELKDYRVREIAEYLIHNPDASFPTSILLSVTEDCAEIEELNNELMLTLKEFSQEEIDERIRLDINFEREEYLKFSGIAKILDGQHRLAGLAKAIQIIKDRIGTIKEEESDQKLLKDLEDFNLNVSIFIGYDIHSQAMLFATVNLAQTKVSRSIVYNMEEYAKTSSPHKTCHEIAKILDAKENSPFYHRIKMLGCKTQGRTEPEPLTQAVVVEALLSLISKNPEKERGLTKKNIKMEYTQEEENKYIFHKLYFENKDVDIAVIIWNYFKAVQQTWPAAWADIGGSLLPKNNCFRALMRYLRDIYKDLVTTENKGIPSIAEFHNNLKEFLITNEDFASKRQLFPFGDSGMNRFYKYLNKQLTYQELKRYEVLE